MNLLLVGDGSTYIDLSTAQAFHVREVTYYKSQRGAWVRKERKNPSGQATSEREAFREFMSAGMFAEAEANFPERFKDGFDVEATSAPAVNPVEPKIRPLLRFIAGGLIGLLLIIYVVAVLMGKISPNRRVSLADLGIIAILAVAISILFRPQLVRNVQRFEFGTFRFELRDQLRELQDTQKDHSNDLDEIRFVLETLVTADELRHLKNLGKGTTSSYERKDSLQAELRRLRSIGLIKTKRYIAQMPDNFDLAEWVELTDRGADYLRRVEKSGSASAATPQQAPRAQHRSACENGYREGGDGDVVAHSSRRR